MKKLLCMLLALAMVLSLAACGGSGSTETTAPAATSAPASSGAETSAPAAPSSLAVCLASEPDTIDPALNSAVDGATLTAHLFAGLAKWAQDANGNLVIEADCATELTEGVVNDDGTVTYTFRLRSAKWSDGRNVRAADFVYAWRRLADPATQSPWASLLSIVSGYDEARETGDMSMLQVSAKNDSTLEVVLDGDYDWFLTQVCTSPATVPLRQDVVQRLKEAGIQAAGEGEKALPWWNDPTELVTNGPFQVTAWEDDVLRMTASERYYGDQPGPSELRFWFAADAAEG